MNAISPASPLTFADLERTLGGIDPAVLLVEPRILRRVIKQDRGLEGLGLQVPHRKSYVIQSGALLRIATREELGLPEDRSLPEALILLPAPYEQDLRDQLPAEVLRDFWRLLFHARIHKALQDRIRAGQLDDAALRERVRQIGLTEFAEIEAVLRQEHFLLPPGDLGTIYEEFASLYLELKYFQPQLLPRYFPTISSMENIDEVLAQDLAAEDLWQATRVCDSRAADALADQSGLEDVQDEQRWWYRHLIRRADRARGVGNVVRSAIFRQRAVQWASTALQPRIRADALDDIEQLVSRLHQALHLNDPEAEMWRQSLPCLLEPGAQGIWPVEARLLYDLQKVCVDQERELYAVDLVEWAASWGNRPIKRPLPSLRLVLRVRYLRHALHRLTAARIPEAARSQLSQLLNAAIHQGEKELRDTLRPRIIRGLAEVGLKPGTLVERLECDKLVEELLDLAVEKGFLTMSDLRDAVARNRLKLPDLAGPGELVLGDPLIRANRRLAAEADGVYHRGEIYLRWLQRLSSLFFGNRVGRLLTLYLAVPFGGAFLVLEGLQHIVVDPLWYLFGPMRLSLRRWATGCFGLLADPLGAGPFLALSNWAALRPSRPHLLHTWSLLLLGFFFLGLLYWPIFRRRFGEAGLALVRGVRWPVWDLPVTVLRLPQVQWFLHSRMYFVLAQYLFKPLLGTLALVLLLYLFGVSARGLLFAGACLFAGLNLLLLSRVGFYLEEVTTDGLVRSWELLRSNLLPDLFRLVVYVFRSMVERIEKLLYTVDEWLRFHGGESRLSLVVKAVLGLFWSLITFIVRFVINLLVEPQINPIKHFPVVTVSHKLVTTLGLFPLAHLLEATFSMRAADALTMSGFICAGIPGIFGFLAWELKENWRLYRANQSPTLDPVIVGHHGETVLRLMRPGFHSGTLPKLFARLRRNLRHFRGQSARKQLEGLSAVEESLHHFLERNLLAVLSVSRAWGTALPLSISHIRLATGRIMLELTCARLGSDGLVIALEQHAGLVVAGIAQIGFLSQASREQCQAFRNALAGFYKLTGVNLVREQLAAKLPGLSDYRITAAGLSSLDKPEQAIPLDGLEFSSRPITWKDWTETWQRDQLGKEHDKLLLPGMCVMLGCNE